MGSFCLFFFQAEDGIRDLTVTGVQTCALPIFLGSFGGSHGQRHRLGKRIGLGGSDCALRNEARSEERRVGKEGRSRGSPDHLKKKITIHGVTKRTRKRDHHIPMYTVSISCQLS